MFPLTHRGAVLQRALFGLIALSLLLPLAQMSASTARAYAIATSIAISIPTVTASPGSVAPGSTESFSATVSSVTALTGAIVDFEVHNSLDQKVYQTFITGVNLAAGTPATFKASWIVPLAQAAGSYRIKLGVFNADWSVRYAWNDTGADFTVQSAPAPPPQGVSIPSVTTSVASVTPGSTMGFTANVYSTYSVSSTHVDFEVYNASWTRVYQTIVSSVNLAANVPVAISASWAVPSSQAAGVYIVKVGVFSSDWTTRLAWNDTGAQFSVGTGCPASSSSPSAIALGAYIHDNGLYAPTDASLMDWYAGLVGRMPAVVMWYQDWVHYPNFSATMMDSVRIRCATPMVTWWAGDETLGANQPAYKLTTITQGTYDSFIRQWATDARNWGHPFFLRFAYEMNGNWMPWGTQPGNPNGNTPADFIAAWRHVHDIFTSVGATNAIWVYSPNITYNGATPYANDYPGDSYVDWVGLDGYNTGTATAGSWWRDIATLFQSSYSSLAAVTSKPMMFAETASTEIGGDKASWITQGFLTEIPANFPRIRAVIWFDANEGIDWRVNSSSGALTAFRGVVANSLYQGKAP